MAIPIDIRWPDTGDTHYPELIADALDVFCTIFHRHELSSKWTCLNTLLLLRCPIDWCIIQKDEEASPWSSCYNVASLISIHISWRGETKSTSFWYIHGQCPMHLTLFIWWPIEDWKLTWINNPATLVKDQFGMMALFQIYKNMEELI